MERRCEEKFHKVIDADLVPQTTFVQFLVPMISKLKFLLIKESLFYAYTFLIYKKNGIMFSPHRNQSINLKSKSADWFPHIRNTEPEWVHEKLIF